MYGYHFAILRCSGAKPDLVKQLTVEIQQPTPKEQRSCHTAKMMVSRCNMCPWNSVFGTRGKNTVYVRCVCAFCMFRV